MLSLIYLICRCQHLQPTSKGARRDTGCPLTVLSKGKKHQRKEDAVIAMNVIIVTVNNHL